MSGAKRPAPAAARSEPPAVRPYADLPIRAASVRDANAAAASDARVRVHQPRLGNGVFGQHSTPIEKRRLEDERLRRGMNALTNEGNSNPYASPGAGAAAAAGAGDADDEEDRRRNEEDKTLCCMCGCLAAISAALCCCGG